MRVITRQLAKEILFSSGFVLIALVALFAFFDLVGQLETWLTAARSCRRSRLRPSHCPPASTK